MEIDDKTVQKAKGFEAEKLLLWLVACAALVLLSLYASNFKALSADTAQWGQLGDYVGGLLNPLVSICTLYVAISVWRLQKAELALTRYELNKARREQRFFDLLNLYQRTVDSLNLEVDGTTFHGKQAMAKYLRVATHLHNSRPIQTFLERGFYDNSQKNRSDYSNLANLSATWNNSHTSTFIDQYFRVIYRILKEANDLLGGDSQRYIKLLRAQLNNHELTLLALNMWLNPEVEDMRPYAATYALLKHLPNRKLKDEVSKVFEPAIFGTLEEAV